MNPYEPSPIYPPDQSQEDSSNVSPKASFEDSKPAKLVASWWFIPILMAGTFSVPVLIIGLGDPNLNPLDFNSILFQAAVNFVVGILAGLVVVVYYHLRTKYSGGVVNEKVSPSSANKSVGDQQ